MATNIHPVKNRPLIWFLEDETANVEHIGAYYGCFQLGRVVAAKNGGWSAAYFMGWRVGTFECPERAKLALQSVLNDPKSIQAM